MSLTALMIFLISARSIFTFPLGFERRYSEGGLDLGGYGDGYIGGLEYGPFVPASFLYTDNPLPYGTQAYSPYQYDNSARYFRGRFSGKKPEEDLSEGLIGGLIGGLILGKSSGDKYIGLKVDGHRIGVGIGLNSLLGVNI